MSVLWAGESHPSWPKRAVSALEEGKNRAIKIKQWVLNLAQQE